MAADLQKFQFKSKFMRKSNNTFVLVILLNFTCCVLVGLVNCSKECSQDCQHGICKEGICECVPGWTGEHCQYCTGRVRLSNESGLITDGTGNYSDDNQCTWLIDPDRPNSFIRLYFNHFATECSWDHLYIYDGGSIYDPLLAVFSGMIERDHFKTLSVPEVVAKSGRALLYFYADAAYNLTGFSISYKVNGCPSSSSGMDCSSHGACLEGECTCDAGWAGPSCTQPLCPANCSDHGSCNMEKHKCICHSGYTGNDCNQKMDLGWWKSEPSASEQEFVSESDLERASHASVAIDDEVWVIGGYSFSSKPFVVAKNVTDGVVRRVEPATGEAPELRYGHSAVVYNGSIYIYGGTKSDGYESSELWKFDPVERTWSLIEGKPSFHNSFKTNRHSDNGLKSQSYDENKVKRKADDRKEGLEQEEHEESSCLALSTSPCTPVASVGHAAVVVKDLFMLIIFGHSSLYGPLSVVQEYNFKMKQWKLIEGEGALVEGVYGHSAVWDSETSLVYVYGGLQSATSNSVVASLKTYDPFTKKWMLKSPAPVPRFLHTAVLMPGTMLIFGGNTHNDTAFSYGSKCYSADFLLHDIHCNSWHILKNPPNLGIDVARYGHTAVTMDRTMVIIAGFNGRMLGNVLYYHPGKCEVYTSKLTCLLAYPGQKCIWNRVLERCEVLRYQDKTAHDFCLPDLSQKNLNYTALCSSLISCHSCLHSSFGCVWCSNGCAYEKCTDYVKGVLTTEGCEDRKRWWCKSLKSCKLCHAYQLYCDWLNKECIYTTANATIDLPDGPTSPASSVIPTSTRAVPSLDTVVATTSSPFAHLNAAHSCPISCSQRTTCVNCTQGPCMWCFSQQRCVSNNSYLVSFPYGQCREWTTDTSRCFYIEKGLSNCMVHQTCKRCQADVGCGWCDDGSNTGTGVCVEGGQSGPKNPASGDLLPAKCPKSQWFFTTCPACNCNGHSHCVNDTCVQPCANNTRGRHCGKCKDSFYGRPINGGLCKSCQCNDHGHTCEHDTGQCHCHTKGVIGDHCQRCDTQNNYFGEPLKGSCFYDLQIDYQFTFNLSKQEDIHIRQINFYNVPSRADVDTDFDIQCSKKVRIKLSSKQTGGQETWIIKNFTGAKIEMRFSASDYVFGSAENNTTFHVYVFNFTPPIEIVISFSQHPKLDLIQFFSIFSLCFMVLLLMAFIMWKIKQKYDIYTRRQRLMVEMEAMASRPFRPVLLELQLNDFDSLSSELDKLVPEDTAVQELVEETCSSELCAKSGKPEGNKLDGSSAVQNSIKKETKALPSSGKKGNKNSLKSVDNHTENASLNGGLQKGTCNGTVSSLHPQMLLHISSTPIIKKKNNPSPVALEPCAGGMAAVLSMLVQLPTGGSKYTPPGHPGGLAIASTLVSLGTPRKSSLEAPVMPKEPSRGKKNKDVNSSATHRTQM